MRWEELDLEKDVWTLPAKRTKARRSHAVHLTPEMLALLREVAEETGLDVRAPGHALTDWALENVYEIYPQWRHRYAPAVTHNTEHVFGLCIPRPAPVQLSPREHRDQVWLPWAEAAERCFSPSNAEAISWLPRLAAKVF